MRTLTASSRAMPTSKGAVNPHLLAHVRVGDELEVWWPLDRAYYPGVVDAALPEGRHRIAYADGDVEELVLAAEQWRFKGAAAERVTAALMRVPPPPAPDVDGSDVSSEALGSAAARDQAGPAPTRNRPQQQQPQQQQQQQGREAK